MESAELTLVEYLILSVPIISLVAALLFVARGGSARTHETQSAGHPTGPQSGRLKALPGSDYQAGDGTIVAIVATAAASMSSSSDASPSSSDGGPSSP